jgi:hypothetical protein
MSGRAETSASDCVTVLRDGAGGVIDWCHLDGYLVRTVGSDALLTRATNPLLLITLTDGSDLHWS